MIAFKKDIYKKFDVEIVSISIDSNKDKNKVRHFIKRYQIPFLILLDSKKEVYNKYPVKSIPATVILNEKGNIIYSSSKFNSKSINEIKSYL